MQSYFVYAEPTTIIWGQVSFFANVRVLFGIFKCTIMGGIPVFERFFRLLTPGRGIDHVQKVADKKMNIIGQTSHGQIWT